MVQIFRDIGCHPHMVEMHHGVNGQIEVTGADTARGRWSLHYFLIDTNNQALTQLGGYYEDGYRRVDGRWKMDATKFVATSTLALKLGEGKITPLFAGGAAPAPA